MNFLQLVTRTMEKCSATGAPATVVSQTGERLRFVNWVNEAWQDIQQVNRQWNWMVGEFTFQTVAATREYTTATIGLTNFSQWSTDTFRAYLTSVGSASELYMHQLDYPSFRDAYMFGTQTQGLPDVFAIRPATSALLLGPIPDAIYTVYGEYFKSASLMALDADTPGMPDPYHMAIVHGARMKYASYENAPEVWVEADRDYRRIIADLQFLQPEIAVCGALA